MGKPVPVEVHEKNVRVFVTNLPSLLLISAIAASSPFSLMNFAASLHRATHSSFTALCAITLAAMTTLAITTNAITATFLIASPFLHLVDPRCSLPPFPFLRLIPQSRRSPPPDRWTNEGFLPRSATVGKSYSWSMREEDRERHRASPTSGMVLRSSRREYRW